MLHLEAQAYFDEHEFDPKNGYSELSNRDQKIRHIQLHVAKAALKLIERDEEVIVSQVIPDTAIYRSQLINLIDEPQRSRVTRILDMEIPVTMVGDGNSWDVDKDASYQSFADSIVSASGQLATYLERLEHGVDPDQHLITRGAMSLDWGCRGLAELYEVDFSTLHLNRLEENLGVSFLPLK